jgi:hypothetical protein
MRVNEVKRFAVEDKGLIAWVGMASDIIRLLR